MSYHSLSGQSVWGLYANYGGGFSRLAGIFSTVDLAKTCHAIQSLLQEPWQYRDIGSGHVIWRAAALDPLQPKDPFHLTIEEITVDRLVEFPENHKVSV